MRSVTQLVHSRTFVAARSALMPLEGFPNSRLPTFPKAQVRVLASPAIGAKFVQYLIDMPEGSVGEFPADTQVETFYFVMSGAGTFHDGASAKHALVAGNFGLTPPDHASKFVASTAMQLLVVRKKYEHAPGIEIHAGVYGHERDVAKSVWADNPNSLLQTLIPDTFAFDLAMNIFTFNPGFGLPIVETHVMEHGAYILEGKGLYYLEHKWAEVEKNDFIYMGPYCPQSFYATGPTPTKYIYYKNVNRDIPL